MYTGYGFRDAEIGDVDVIWVDGTYHLFHLVLPNHDYIAHAVSDDGFTWRRVQNALFIGDPGSWDDDMLWTMHVSREPDADGYRMFYTALSLRERGRIQRVGVARSDDLYRWEKVEGRGYPVEADPEHYEASLDEGRHWVSWRDPFAFEAHGERYLTVAGRVNDGPLIRRGCAALLRWDDAAKRWRGEPPLFHPRRYDDIEVPTVVSIGDRWYLVGSIREDVKVHYWIADEPLGPYRNFSDNVLLPQGNYAARVAPCGDALLVWNFFRKLAGTRRRQLLPPPKELRADDDGELYITSFSGFDRRVVERRTGGPLNRLEPLFAEVWNGDAERLAESRVQPSGDGCVVERSSGFETFLLPGRHRHVRLSGTLGASCHGKLGLVARLDEDGATRGDGYYLSLDLRKGIAQLRAWQQLWSAGEDPEAAFEYQQLQAAHAVPRPGPHPFVFIAYGSYLEFSLHGRILLSLSDATFREGRFGFYVESGRVEVQGLTLETLDCHEDRPAELDWVGSPKPDP